MNRKSSFSLLRHSGLWLLIFGLLTACANGPQKAESRGSADVSVMGIDLAEMRSARLNGVLRASFVLKNTSRRVQSLQYKVIWFDRHGDETEQDASYWEPVVIQPGASKEFSQSAPMTTVKNFKIIVK